MIGFFNRTFAGNQKFLTMNTNDNGKKTHKGLNALLHNEAAVGILLLACALVAVAMASFPETMWFDKMWNKDGSITVGDFSITMSIRHWINDALMAIFFFVVGLEIKKEMLIGRLSSLKKSALPVMAAIGGMIVPALIFTAFNAGNPETSGGWGIPMATDIAFAIGIISLLGSRVNPGLKVFLTALAIVDDLGAIIVLAIFYPSHALHFGWLVMAGIVLVILFLFNRGKLDNRYFYIIAGLFLWYFILMSGIHATVAGVLLAMTIPSKGHSGEYHDSLMHRFERGLRPFVNFVVIPLFALANAGVALDFSSFSGNGIPTVSLGIFFGLLVGKPVGILLLSWIGVKFRIASLPDGIRWSQVAAMGILGGIGFTMSIFINSLAFRDPGLTDIGKMSILLTSAVAAVLGIIMLWLTCRKDSRQLPPEVLEMTNSSKRFFSKTE